MSQTYIIECSRINSVGVEGSGEDYDNKSSWTNQIAPIYLRQGDTVSLQNCLINIPGADTNAIQFQGTETTPGSQIQDNFTLMNVGFYMNHNGINTLAMPCQYLSAGDPNATPPVAQETKTMLTETSKTIVDGEGNTVIANNLGSFQDIQYIFDPPGNPGSGPLNGSDQINDSRSWQGNNPYFNINGKKFAKISPYYGGWWRDTSDTAYQGNGKEPLLFTQDIPFLINPGFTTPNSIADQMTEILSRTNKLRVDDIFTARAQEVLAIVRNTASTNNYQYAFNGYAYKTISANFQKHGDMTHRIYGNLAVDEPYLWKYGINIISNAEVDNLQGNRYITEGQDADYANFRVDYPVVIWNIFAGDNPDDFDIENEGQYRYYSPFVSKLEEGAGDDTILTTEGFTTNLSTFNDYLRQIITTNNVGAYLYMSSANSFKIGLTSSVGINLVEKPGLFEDNDTASHTDIIAYNRFLGLNGSWDAIEHQIFKTTDIGQPGGTGTPYVYSGAGAASEDWFDFFVADNKKIAMGNSTGGLGFTGYVYISNLLTEDSGGIEIGGDYKITFDIAIQPPYSWANTSIGLGGSPVGLPFTTYTSDQSVEVEFTATASSIAANAIAIGVYYSGTAAIVNVSNISILREHTGTDEIYTVANIWTSDYTDTEDNKIYSIQKNNSQSNVELEITDNVLPVQTPTWVGVDYNRVYTLLTKGLVFGFVSGSYTVTNSLTTHDPNVSIFYNDEDPDYTYWLYQTQGSPGLWYVGRFSKYNGGIPENGDIIGTLQSNVALMKYAPRAGQQFFDLQGSNPYNFTSNFVDLSAGNNWNTNPSFTGNSYSMINHIGDGLTITIGGNPYPYDWELDQQGGGQNEYYFQLNADGVSGNWKYETGASEGTWTYNGTNIVATATAGSGFTLYSASPPALSNKIIQQISITNENFNSPPTLPWDAAREYYFSFQRYISTADGYRTYYISNFLEQNKTDNSMEGLEGTVYTSPGAANEGTWTLNTSTKTWTSGIATDPVELTTSTTLTLTNIVQYPTSQNYIQTGITYSIPVDGEQYGNGYNGFGATDVETVSSPIKYLGCENNTDFDNRQDITSGKEFDDINDSFVADNGRRWNLTQDAGNARYLLRITDSSGQIILTLAKPYSEIFQKGWIILRCDSKTREELQTNDTEITGITTRAYFTTTTEDIGDGRVAPNTNGENGTQYQFYENYAFSPVYDRGTLKLFENADTDTAKARIQKHQLLMTNIKLTMDNLEKINDFFRYTETYEGTETKRANIIADVDNYYTMVDFGRGDDGVVDITSTLASTNTTGKTPVVPEYMRDKGTINEDGGGSDNANIGCLCPRLQSHAGDENRLKIFTRWQDDYNTRMVAEGMLDYTYTYGDTLTLQVFKTTYADLYNYCVNNNVGIIPFKAKDGTLRVGFEVYQDYINEELLKIQNLSYFLYSPSFVDHDYVAITNKDDPATPPPDSTDPDYQYSQIVSDMMNFLNIGAHKPTIEYNNDLSRFSFSYWHTPTYFNEKTEGGATAQLGDEVAIFFDNNDIITNKTFPRARERGQDLSNRNTGINESQAGIFLNEVYFQRVNSSTIILNTDPLAVKMTKDNFYNSFWFKLGYSYYDLKPLRFNFKSFHDNRFSQIAYNNLSPDIRATSIVPFTTNAFLSINNMPSMNQFTVMSDDPNTPDPKAGTPIFGLGYNNNEIVAVECESASLFPKSLPVNISSGYYRIYTDLPIDTLEYNAGGSRLAVVGSALLNYASSSQFFYSYGMDYNATITKDVLINNVKIEIRTDRGELVKGLGDRSLVVLKVIRSFQQTIPQNPELDELKKIENLLKNEAEDKEKPRTSADTAQDLYNLIKDLPLEQDKDQQRKILNSFFDVIDTNVKGKTKATRVNILKNVTELLNKARNKDLRLEQLVAYKSLSDVVLNPNKQQYLEAQRGQWVTEILNNLDIELRKVRAKEPASIIDLPRQEQEEKEIQRSSDILRGFDPELREIETKTDKGGGAKKE